jgi:hypothetical protein
MLLESRIRCPTRSIDFNPDRTALEGGAAVLDYVLQRLVRLGSATESLAFNGVDPMPLPYKQRQTFEVQSTKLSRSASTTSLLQIIDTINN